jgi:Mitochondrial 28S ribosomal protein S34
MFTSGGFVKNWIKFVKKTPEEAATMATIKYIGRTTDFKGKTLWQIVSNLKNFGVGRVVG